MYTNLPGSLHAVVRNSHHMPDSHERVRSTAELTCSMKHNVVSLQVQVLFPRKQLQHRVGVCLPNIRHSHPALLSGQKTLQVTDPLK